MRAILFALATLAAMSAHADWFGSACQEFANRSAAQPAAGVTRVVIIARAGFLHVEGRPNVGEIRATGQACAPIEHQLAGIRLAATRSGSTVTIEAFVPKEDWSFFSSSPKLDFTVTLPAGMEIDVADTSGELIISNVGNTRIADTSGSIEVRNVTGGLTVRDTSGSIDIAGVSGDVHIPSDSSGSIRIERVHGSVLIDDDGSGSVEVFDVGGDFTLREKGSGSIDYHGIRGRISVPSRHHRG